MSTSAEQPTSHRNDAGGPGRFLRFRFLWKVAAVAVLVVLASMFFSRDSGEAATSGTTFTVKRGLLPITVVEGGGAESLNPSYIRCEVKGGQRSGRTKIKSIVEEGYRVTRQDIDNKKVLMELDASELEESIRQQKNDFEASRASLAEAKQSYEVQENQNDTDIKAGERDVKFKSMDLQKYLGEALADDLIADLTRRRAATKAAKNATAAATAATAAQQALDTARMESENAAKAAEEAKARAAAQPEDAADAADKKPAEGDTKPARPAGRRGAAGRGGGRRGGGRGGSGKGMPDMAKMPPEVLAAMRARMENQEGEESPQALARKAEVAVQAAAAAETALTEANTALDAATAAMREAADKAGGTVQESAAGGIFTVSFDLVDFRGLARSDKLKGEAEQRRKDFESQLALAGAQLIMAEEKLKGTAKLAEKDFVTSRDLETETLNVTSSRISLESKRKNEELFFRYEFPKQAEQYYSSYEEALRKLDRVEQEATIKMMNAQVRLASRQERYDQEDSQLKDKYEQRDNCKVYASIEGLIVYGEGHGKHRRWRGSNEPIREGTEVYFRQTVITIPDITQMAVKVGIHESTIKQVKKGQKATLRVEAFPDDVLTGEVTKVSVLPSSEDSFLTPEMKLYDVTVSVDGVHEWLKPGMTAEVTIHVAELEDILYVPIQSVTSRENDRVCFLKSGDPVVVETGQFNANFIEIKNGLEDGDEILLRPLISDVEASEDQGPARPDATEETEAAPEA